MKLTQNQINRCVYGSFAYAMSDAQIETMAQALQDRLNAESEVRRIDDAHSKAKSAKAKNTDKRLATLADRVMDAIE